MKRIKIGNKIAIVLSDGIIYATVTEFKKSMVVNSPTFRSIVIDEAVEVPEKVWETLRRGNKL